MSLNGIRLVWQGIFGRLSFAILVLLALNLALVFAPGRFTLHIGPWSFPAQSAYKPLLLLNGGFVLTRLLAHTKFGAIRAASPGVAWLGRLGGLRFSLLLAALVTAVYLPSLGVNLQHHDWTHRHISAGLTSLSAIARLFVAPQPDGMYRPLTFLSLWLDYSVFGPHLWGYHIQNIAIHTLNAVLASLLAVQLGLSRSAGRLAALVFGLGAIHFEAVLWPAARFDLLAAMFSFLALILFLKHWRAPGVVTRYGVLSLACLVLAVLNKESAYSAGLLMATLVLTRRLWRLEPIGRTKALAFFAATGASIGVLVTVRFLIYKGLGGYGYSQGHSVYSALTAKSVYWLVVNSLALPVFAINTTIPDSLWAMAILISFGCLVVVIAGCSCVNQKGRQWALIGLTLLSALSAANVIGWIQPSLLHSRYLYWPSLWMALFLATILERCSLRGLVFLFLVIQAAGVSYNVWVYKDLIERADRIAGEMERRAGAARAIGTEICILNVPGHPNGVFLFREELQERIGRGLPGARVRFSDNAVACGSGNAKPGLVYLWNQKSRTAVQVQ